LKVAGHISSVKQLCEALNRARKHIAVLVQRNGNMMFIPLRDWFLGEIS